MAEDAQLVAFGLFQPEDRANAGEVERHEHLRLALEPGRAIRFLGKVRGQGDVSDRHRLSTDLRPPSLRARWLHDVIGRSREEMIT